MGSLGARILLIEDSALLSAALRAVLEHAGHEVLTSADGESASRCFAAQRPDVVLLDVGLPRIDGWTVLDRIRALDDTVPVVMLTGAEDEASKVRGLNGGADDYLVKPVGAAELVARVAAQLRRRRSGEASGEVFDDGHLRLDFARRRVVVDGREVALTPLEFRLLATLVRRAGEVLSPGELMELVWNDYTGLTTDSVKVYVGYLRRKLGRRGAERLQTVRGYGYRYVTS